MNAEPDVLNHNTETVPRLYRQVRLGAQYKRSLDMLQYAKTLRRDAGQSRGSCSVWARRSTKFCKSCAICSEHGVDILRWVSICGLRRNICRSFAT